VLSVDAASAGALADLLRSEGETVVTLGRVTDTGDVRYTGSLL
jgi:hypothetical protein